MAEPITYEEWSKSKGVISECGLWVALPDAFAKNGIHDAIEHIAKLMAKAMAECLFKGGASVPLAIKHSQERSPGSQSWVHYFTAQATQECLPEPYLLMAYTNWQDEYNARLYWENLSLAQYIKQWRRMRRKRRSENWR